MGQGDAPGRGEEVRRRGSSSGSPLVSNFTGDARRRAEIRREISSSSMCLEQRREKGREEDAWGLL
jgi:hypothetical protein